MKCLPIILPLLIKDNITRIVLAIYSWIYFKGQTETSAVSFKEQNMIGTQEHN